MFQLSKYIQCISVQLKVVGREERREMEGKKARKRKGKLGKRKGRR